MADKNAKIAAIGAVSVWTAAALVYCQRQQKRQRKEEQQLYASPRSEPEEVRSRPRMPSIVAAPEVRPPRQLQRRGSWQEPKNTEVGLEPVRVSMIETEWRGGANLTDSEDELLRPSTWQEAAGLPLSGTGVFIKMVDMATEDKEWAAGDALSDEDAPRRQTWQEAEGIPLRGSGVCVTSVRMSMLTEEWDADDESEEGSEDADEPPPPSVGYKRGSKFDMAMDPEVYQKLLAMNKGEETKPATMPKDGKVDKKTGKRKSWQVDILADKGTEEKGKKLVDSLQKQVDVNVHAREWEYAQQLSDSDEEDGQGPTGEPTWKSRVTWQERSALPLQGSAVHLMNVDKQEHDGEWRELEDLDTDDETDYEADDEKGFLRKTAEWQETNGLPLRKSAVFVKKVNMQTAETEWAAAVDFSDSDPEQEAILPVVPFRRGSYRIPALGAGQPRPESAALPKGAGCWGDDESSPKRQGKRGSWMESTDGASVEMKSIPMRTLEAEWNAAGEISESDEEEAEPEAPHHLELGYDASAGKLALNYGERSTFNLQKRASWQELAGLPLWGSAVAIVPIQVAEKRGEWVESAALSDSDEELGTRRRGSWQEQAGQPLQGTGVYVKPVQVDSLEHEWGADDDGEDAEEEQRVRGSQWQREAGLPLQGSGVYRTSVKKIEAEQEWQGGKDLSDSEAEVDQAPRVSVKARGSMIINDVEALKTLQQSDKAKA